MTKFDMIKSAINAQAEDHSIWFIADSISEAYLQQSLRWLHKVIEDGDQKAFDSIIEQSAEHL